MPLRSNFLANLPVWFWIKTWSSCHNGGKVRECSLKFSLVLTILIRASSFNSQAVLHFLLDLEFWMPWCLSPCMGSCLVIGCQKEFMRWHSWSGVFLWVRSALTILSLSNSPFVLKWSTGSRFVDLKAFSNCFYCCFFRIFENNIYLLWLFKFCLRTKKMLEGSITSINWL